MNILWECSPGRCVLFAFRHPRNIIFGNVCNTAERGWDTEWNASHLIRSSIFMAWRKITLKYFLLTTSRIYHLPLKSRGVNFFSLRLCCRLWARKRETQYGINECEFARGVVDAVIPFQFNYDNNIYHCRDNERLMHQRIILHSDQFFIFAAKTFSSFAVIKKCSILIKRRRLGKAVMQFLVSLLDEELSLSAWMWVWRE